MARRNKSVKVGEHKFQLKQLSAIDGCYILENYGQALTAFTQNSQPVVERLTKQHYIVKSPTRALYALFATLGVGAYTAAENLFNRLLDGCTDDAGAAVDIDWITAHPEQAVVLLVHILQLNFYDVWVGERFQIPQKDEEAPKVARDVQYASDNYSQSHMIYTLIKSEFATFADLSNGLNTEDAYNLYEMLSRRHVEQLEMQKEAERQAAQQARN
ncbi:hypothetical protein [Pseudomonas sp.]|uniref:hypothetical protein n=1 Tax=Pseudomonas sp. TaxID=306 RepID=UPI002FC7BC08